LGTEINPNKEIIMTWTSAQNNDIEIRIDLEHPKKVVEFRRDGEKEWTQTPFQGYKFNCGIDEEMAALICVDKWHDSQSS
jgi:hypothetical protein